MYIVKKTEIEENRNRRNEEGRESRRWRERKKHLETLGVWDSTKSKMKKFMEENTLFRFPLLTSPVWLRNLFSLYISITHTPKKLKKIL